MVRILPLLIILFFTASWCVPCQKAKPIIKSLIDEGYDITIIEHPDPLFKEYNITKLPTLLINNKKYPGLRTKKQYKRIIDGKEKVD